MLRDRRFLTAGILSSVALTVAVIACSSDPTTSTFTNAVDSGAETGSQTFNPDAGQPTTDADVQCTPQKPTTFDPQWIPPVAQNVCSDADIEGYYDACLSTTSAFDSDTCLNWVKNNASCGSCIEKTDNSGPIQSFRSRLYYTLNNAGCIALQQKNTDASGCGAAYDKATQCRRDSCDHCFDNATNQQTFDEFLICQQTATTTGCTTENDAAESTCAGYKDDDGGVPQCFPITSTDGGATESSSSKSFYLRIMQIFCEAG